MWLVMACASMPVQAHAEEKKVAASSVPAMHFMRLPPRRIQPVSLAARGQANSLKAIARSQPHAAAPVHIAAENSPQPPASDKQKLLLYVYDEMR